MARAATTAVCCRMMRDRRGLGEPRVDDGEDDEGHDQQHQRAERGMGVQQMLDPLQRRLLPQRELLRRGTQVPVVRLRLSRGLPCRRRYSGFGGGDVAASVMGWLRPAGRASLTVRAEPAA